MRMMSIQTVYTKYVWGYKNSGYSGSISVVLNLCIW